MSAGGAPGARIARSERRRSIRRAMFKEKAPVHDVPLLINDGDLAAGDNATFERFNPVTATLATRASAADVEDARAAVDAAAGAFPAWSRSGPGERRRLLNRAADLVVERTADFAEAIIAETGGTAGWAEFNCALAADMLREAAAMTTQVLGEVIPTDRTDAMAFAIRQPCGVVFSMAPWNAPVVLGVRALAMPLACGNTVVLKASELCPRTHRLVVEVLRDAGLPPGTVNFIANAPDNATEIVEAIIAHPAVRRITFTGSTRVGRLIAQIAAKYVKRCLLELGGKAPLVVLDDADIEAAVEAATFGSFYHQGQICMATERLIVDEAVADEFVELLAARAQDIVAGDPSDPACRLGSMIDVSAAQRVRSLIDDAVGKGATLVTGGRTEGAFLDATILDRVTPSMRIYAEESFGPIAAVIRVGDEEEAIAFANDTEYGLSAAVFSRDVGRAWKVALRIESGICHINGATINDEAQMPFGGVKASGYGRFGGRAAIDEFTELRWITVQSGPQNYAI